MTAGNNPADSPPCRVYPETMTDFALLLEAPDRAWADHVQSLLQRALGVRGSVSLGLPGEQLPDAPPSPATS